MRIFRNVFIMSIIIMIAVIFSAEAGSEKKIGILMFSDEKRYYEAAKGMMDKLTEDGFGKPETKFIIENAKGNKAKAAELVLEFSAAKMDLIFTLGTSAAVAVSREIKDVPVVFGMVYDPVAAGIARDWKSSGNNTTGASPNVPMSIIMDRLKEFMPVKRLAVLYTPGEKNSETQLKDLQAIQEDYKIKVIPVPLTKTEEASQLLPEVVRTSDAIYITGSNTVSNVIPMLVDMTTKAKVVTLTHLEDIVEKGALLGVCSDPYLVGRLAGEKAVMILKGDKPSSIPIEAQKDYNLIINMKTVKTGQFQIPPGFMNKVKRKIQ